MQFLLGTEDGDEEHIPHALFTELDEICLREGEDAEWKETARYTPSRGGLGLAPCHTCVFDGAGLSLIITSILYEMMRVE